MKKILLIISFLLAGYGFILAQSNYEITGQIRPRFQMDNKNFNGKIPSSNFTELRTRLGIKISPIENLSGFVQIQDSRIFGTEPSTLDPIDNIDLHQAYFTLNKIFSLPINLKIGRMELSYGPQRLIGSVDWSNIGRSFDGGLVQFSSEKVDIDLFTAKLNEKFNPADSLDNNLIGLYADLKIVENYKIQPFLINENVMKEDGNRTTFGAYINGNIDNFSHEVEAAYQFGSLSNEIEISAYMLALNLNYKIESQLKPSIGGGIDFLSGDDGNDINTTKVFNTLYATNHKYYGFMDYFVNIPSNTMGLGLVDFHLKGEISPIEKLKTNLALHIFNSAAEYKLFNNSKLKNFGSEIDFTISYNYNSAVNFTGGFSLFFPGDIFKQVKGKDISTWTYLMAIVNL